MENYGDAMKYAEIAADSAGTANEKFSAWLEGIEGKLQSLQSTFETLSLTILDSDLITGSISVIDGLLKGLTWIIDKVGGLNTLLYITVGILATIKADSIWTFVLKFFPNLFALLGTGINKILELGATFIWARVMGKDMGDSISTAFSQIGITASAAQVAVGSFMAILGIAIAATNIYNSQVEKRINNALDSARAAHEEGNAYLETTKSLNELIKEYEQLSKASGGTFSGESAEKVRTIQDKITKLVGDQANNIDLVNGKLDEEIKKLREIAGANANSAKTQGQVQVANAKNAWEEKTTSVFAPWHAIEGTGKSTALWGLSTTGGEQINFVEEWANEYGVELEESENSTGFGIKSSLLGLKNRFESFETFVLQYENILKLNAALSKDYGDSGLFKATSEYLSEYKDIYNQYTSGNKLIEEAQKIKDGIDEIFDKPKNNGIAVALKSELDIIEEVKGGYDGISDALANLSSEGYLTADSLTTLLKLEQENALAGLKLEDILIRDAKGYKLADNALNMYVQSLIKQYAAIESIKTAQDAANAISNLELLLSILSTLSYEGQKDSGSTKLEDQLEKQKDALNEQIDAYKELIDLRKDLLESYVDELKYEEELAKKQDNVAKLKTKLTVAKLDDSAAGKARVRELEEQLKEAEEDLNEFTLEHAVDEMTQTLENQYNEYKFFIDKRLAEISEEISKIGEKSSGKGGFDTSWLKTAIEEIKKSILRIENNLTTLYNGMPEFVVVFENWASLPATNPMVPEPELLKGKGKWISKYHTGGIVGDTRLGRNEEFAKLLKGEFVSTPAQMRRFIEDTLPRIITYASSGETNEFNAPLVEINCESVTSETLPELKQIVNEAVKEIKRELDSGMSRTGFKRQAKHLI